MSRFTVEVVTDNAAFDAECGGDLSGELSRIMHVIAAKLEAGDVCGDVFDVNGNRVGRFEASDGE